MTTDNQKVEVPESVKDVDAYCLAEQKIYLQTLIRRYNEYKNIKELKEHCENTLSNQEIEQFLDASGYSNIEELPVAEKEMETLLNNVLTMKKSEVDPLINSLKKSTSDCEKNLVEYNKEIGELERELTDLKAKHSSDTNQLLCKIDEFKDKKSDYVLSVDGLGNTLIEDRKSFWREVVILGIAFVIFPVLALLCGINIALTILAVFIGV